MGFQCFEKFNISSQIQGEKMGSSLKKGGKKKKKTTENAAFKKTCQKFLMLIK